MKILVGLTYFFTAMCGCLAAVLVVMLITRAGYFDPKPFRNVYITSIERTGPSGMHVEGGFESLEHDCGRPSIYMYAILPVSYELIHYEVTRPPNTAEARLPGPQEFVWDIDFEEYEPRQVQVWVSYSCSGRPLDKLMVTLTVPEFHTEARLRRT